MRKPLRLVILKWDVLRASESMRIVGVTICLGRALFE